MAKLTPWHSAQDGHRVCHNNDQCSDGTVDHYWMRHGTGLRPLCEQCAQLEVAEPKAPLAVGPDDWKMRHADEDGTSATLKPSPMEALP